MDRMEDSGSSDVGSIPAGATKKIFDLVTLQNIPSDQISFLEEVNAFFL